jgi:hypothetical protein
MGKSKVDRRRDRAALRASTTEPTQPMMDELSTRLSQAEAWLEHGHDCARATVAGVALLAVEMGEMEASAATIAALRRVVEDALVAITGADRDAWQQARDDVRVVLAAAQTGPWIETIVMDGGIEVSGVLVWQQHDEDHRIITIPHRLDLSVSATREHVLHGMAQSPSSSSLWRQLEQRLPLASLQAPRLQTLVIDHHPSGYGEVHVAVASHAGEVELGCCAGPLALLLADGEVDELAAQATWRRFVVLHDQRSQHAPAVLPATSWWWGSAWLRVLARSAAQVALTPTDGCVMDVDVDDRDDGPRLVFTLGGGAAFELDPADASLSLPGGVVVATAGVTMDGDHEAVAAVLQALSFALAGTEVDLEMTIDDRDWWLSDYLAHHANDVRDAMLPLHDHSTSHAQQWWRIVDALTEAT